MRCCCSSSNLVALVCGAVLALAPARAHAEPETAECTASVDGHVVDAVTHEAVAGADVRVGGQLLAQTDAAGRFTLKQLCPGPMTVAVERPDYQPYEQLVKLAGAISLELELTLLGGETITIKEQAPDPPPMQSATTIDGAALERTRGRGFSEALADVPGVGQLQSSTGMAKPIIRGQFGRRLLLLVDDVRHRAQEWGLEHAPELDPFLAGKIRVVRGVGGVRYGPDAIGGVVLVDPPDLRREPGYQGEAHLVGTSNGHGGAFAGRLQYVPEARPALALQLEGTVKRLAGARTPDYALDNTGVLDWSAGATVAYRGEDGQYTLSYRRYQADLGVCSCLRIENVDDFFASIERGSPQGAELFDSDFGIDRPKQAVSHDLAIGRARWDRGWGSLTATYAFQYDLRREFDVVRQATKGAQFNFRLQSHDLAVVAGHRPLHLSEHWHLRGEVGVVGAAQLHAYTGLNLVPDHVGFGGGVYALERLTGHDWEFEAGVRYDVLDRTAEIESDDFARLVRSGQLAETACGDPDAEPVECHSRFHTLTASAGALYRFTEALTGKLELSTASRPPNPDEQYLNGTAPTFPVLGLGKPDLRPETTYSTSATVSYQSSWLAAEASTYANVIRDYIYFAPAFDDNGMPIFDVLIRGTFPRFTTRPVDALFYGADGGVTVTPHASLELAAQVSLVRAKNTRDDSYLVFVPADRGRASATYRADALGLAKTYASVTGTYVARQRRFDLAADFAAPPPGYFTLDAEVGTEFGLGHQTAKLALEGRNLTNARYRDYTSLLRYFADEPGWQVWLRASVFFDSTSK